MILNNIVKPLILFDLDGTVIDTEKAIRHSLKDTLNSFGIKKDDLEINALFGIPAEETLHKLGVPKQHIQSSLDQWNNLREKYRDEMTFFENMENTLQNLTKKNYQIGVVTSRTEEEINRELSNKNLERFFKHIITVEDTKKPKPNSEPLEYACSLFGVDDPNRVIYVGDSIYDYECAKNFGCKFILAGWGFKIIPDDDRKKSHYILYNPVELIDVIENF